MILPLLKGLQLTFRTFFTRPITIQYPEEKMVMHPRFRGLHQLARDPEGKILCVACELCAAVCPANCIRVEPGEGPTHRRFPKVYEIDLGRCIFCGFCQEACPYGAILLQGNFEIANYTRKDLIYNRDQLIHAYDPK
ncbi:MAG: NADH-quinone oxidoreductase subunit I [Deltaproteobacteria bacterium SM23_61]|nr:MAG: NADH-quinone oxidoreductase subunit I [Deltaproteobacteria bacterium SM23_61]